MRYLLCLFLALTSLAWSQQDSSKNPPPPSSPPAQSSDASGLSRDKSFPEDTPAPSAPASDPTKARTPSMAPPRSDRVQVEDLGPGAGQSSSKETEVDLSPPEDDAKAHPKSSEAVADAEAAALTPGGVSEFHAWDPHKAAKDVEIGDFYFKRKNYRAAEDRYREALRYKDNDAVATIRLAVCLEKLGILDDARAEYESYLKILPHGPQASEAEKAIDRLKGETAAKQ
ncbi:MAG: tetratricopeptide repeat protein [Candidatus Sulfotelmatobacter sp.]